MAATATSSERYATNVHNYDEGTRIDADDGKRGPPLCKRAPQCGRSLDIHALLTFIFLHAPAWPSDAPAPLIFDIGANKGIVGMSALALWLGERMQVRNIVSHFGVKVMSFPKKSEGEFMAKLAAGDEAGGIGGSKHLVAALPEVHLFEVNPPTFELLQLIARKSYLPSKHWHLHHMGVSDVEGSLPVYGGRKKSQGPDGVGNEMSGLAKVGKKLADVPVTTLDVFLARRQLASRDILYVKIDTEGFDLNVMRGMNATLASGRPHFLSFEYNPLLLHRALGKG
jgi:FkbM family methyltransferase